MLSGFVKCAAAACGMEINRLLIISVYSFRHTVSCLETLDCELLSPALTPGVFGISPIRSVALVTWVYLVFSTRRNNSLASHP